MFFFLNFSVRPDNKWLHGPVPTVARRLGTRWFNQLLNEKCDIEDKYFA